MEGNAALTLFKHEELEKTDDRNLYWTHKVELSSEQTSERRKEIIRSQKRLVGNCYENISIKPICFRVLSHADVDMRLTRNGKMPQKIDESVEQLDYLAFVTSRWVYRVVRRN